MANNDRKSTLPDFNVYAVNGEGKSAFWVKLGAAWKHREGDGFNLVLQALPLNNRLVLLPPKEQDETIPTRAAATPPGPQPIGGR